VAAQHVASEDPLNSFYSVKRLIGRAYANCYRESGYLVYKLAEGEAGETMLWSPARRGPHFDFLFPSCLATSLPAAAHWHVQFWIFFPTIRVQTSHLHPAVQERISANTGASVSNLPSHKYEITEREVILYALGVGCQRKPCIQSPSGSVILHTQGASFRKSYF